MRWLKRLGTVVKVAREHTGRAYALGHLRTLSPRLLRDSGFSPELINQGLKAWPWRLEENEFAVNSVFLHGMDTEVANSENKEKAA
jgi:hypothetical protein